MQIKPDHLSYKLRAICKVHILLNEEGLEDYKKSIELNKKDPQVMRIINKK